MRIQTETPISDAAAHYILIAKGWKYREGPDGNEYIQHVQAEGFGNIVEYNRFSGCMKFKIEMHEQEILAVLKVLHII